MAEPTLTIRAATPADLGALDRLLAASYPALLKADYPPSLMVTAVPLLARAQPRLLASGSYYLALDADGGVIAAGGWSRAGGGTGRRPGDVASVRHVVTDHRLVRRGIGARLLTHVLTCAAEAGVRQLDCLSTLTAAGFYRSLGFMELDRIFVGLAPGIRFPVVRMQRRLPAPGTSQSSAPGEG